jgi:hypothetical protein
MAFSKHPCRLPKNAEKRDKKIEQNRHWTFIVFFLLKNIDMIFYRGAVWCFGTSLTKKRPKTRYFKKKWITHLGFVGFKKNRGAGSCACSNKKKAR